MSQPLNPADLLRLISDDELAAFAECLGGDLAMPVSRQGLRERIASCSRARLLAALIAINGAWMTMMRDIVRFLERFDLALRTTGCVLALPIGGKDVELYLSPQLTATLALYDPAAYRRRALSDWDEALSRWRALSGWIQRTVDDAGPRSRRRYSSRRVIEAGMGRPVADFYERDLVVDQQAAARLVRLWQTVRYLNGKLEPVVGWAPPESPAGQLACEVRDRLAELDSQIEQMRSDADVWSQLPGWVKEADLWTDSWSAEQRFADDDWQNDRGWDDWVRFIEDVLSLASLETSTDVVDLLKLDLLKDRPRLFEVWCMAQVLSMYRTAGCTVELLSIERRQPPVWNLNYARAATPVARITRGASQWWFFYQLFSSGPERANMPDFALLDGSDPDSKVVWIADPKYSEAKGYSYKDYIEVAERYRDTFQPRHVWICEFFPRREWFDGACHQQGDRFTILTEVQPGGEGIRLLRAGLQAVHAFPVAPFVLAVDCSGSFSSVLLELEAELRALSECAAAVVCFASEAREITDIPLSLFVVQREREALGGGTLLCPLVALLGRLGGRVPASTGLVLLTDGDFSDAPGEWMGRLGALFADIDVASDPASVAGIFAARCGT